MRSRLAWRRSVGPVSPAACQSDEFCGIPERTFLEPEIGFNSGRGDLLTFATPPKKDESELSFKSIPDRYGPWAFGSFVSIPSISKREGYSFAFEKKNYHKIPVDAMGGHSIYHWKIPTTKNRKTKKTPILDIPTPVLFPTALPPPLPIVLHV